MSVQVQDPAPLAEQLRDQLVKAGVTRTPATLGEAFDRIARNPCEADFVVGDCLSVENLPLLEDVTGGEPCWPCYARKVLRAVKQ